MNTRVRHGHSQAYNPSIAVAWLRRELSAPAAIVVFDCALCRVEPVRLAIGREIGDLIDERRKFGCSRHPQQYNGIAAKQTLATLPPGEANE